MAAVLHPDHGTVIMNLHGGGIPARSAILELFSRLLPGRESSGYATSTEQGKAVHTVTAVLR